MELRLPNLVAANQLRTYAPRPASLKGLRVGFLDGWGEGPGSQMYPAMAAIERRLIESGEVTTTVWQKKPSISSVVPDDMLKAFLARVDVVVNGEGL